jgi:hypothetical protein
MQGTTGIHKSPSTSHSYLEKTMLKNAFDSPQCLNHICAVSVQVPKLTIVALMGPPKGVHSALLIHLEFSSKPPTTIVRQRVAIFAEKSIDARDTSVPRIFKIFQCQAAILSIGLLSLERILSPNTLGVNKLALPWLKIPEEIWDQLVGVVAKTGAEMSHSHFRLLAVPEIALWDKHMSHRQHTKPSKFLWTIENYWRESTWHLTVQPNLDTSLDLILVLDEQIK